MNFCIQRFGLKMILSDFEGVPSVWKSSLRRSSFGLKIVPLVVEGIPSVWKSSLRRSSFGLKWWFLLFQKRVPWVSKLSSFRFKNVLGIKFWIVPFQKVPSVMISFQKHLKTLRFPLLKNQILKKIGRYRRPKKPKEPKTEGTLSRARKTEGTSSFGSFGSEGPNHTLVRAECAAKKLAFWVFCGSI